MPSEDTIKLLKECNAGSKMAVSSIREVLDHVKGNTLSDLLEKAIKKHEEIGDCTHELLAKYKDQDKEPNAMAKAMSWMKTNTKLMIHGSDAEVAELISDGCHMGIKSVSRYMNQFSAANEEAKKLACDLIKSEQILMDDLRKYL